MKTFFHVNRHGVGVAVLCLASAAFAAVDVEPFEQLIQQGKPEQAMAMLSKELELRPDHPRLLYNYGVAAYAAKRYDEALLSFDKVEFSRDSGLAERARKQKGNAEFHLGLAARTSNLDETIERWKNSLDQYRVVLKESPRDTLARTNHNIVEKLLMDLLLKSAQKHMDEAHVKWRSPDDKIENLRAAMEKFQEAKQVNEQNEQAQKGEKQAREELANLLAEQGEKRAKLKPDQPAEWQIKDIEKGVNQLEDAHTLLPEDKPIEQKLEAARQVLADALTKVAKKQIEEARKNTWEEGKFQQLNKALDNTEKALEQKPDHEEAQRTQQEAKDELAKLHEEKADRNAREAERASLPQQVQKLETALDNYQQAEEFKPNDAALQEKANTTQAKLEDALEKLGDRLMQEPPKEGLDEKAARLENAQQAFEDLEQLKPSEPTEKKLDEVGRKLADVRQQLAQQAKQQPRPQAQPQAQQPPQQPEPNGQNQPQVADMEKMPQMKQQPLGKGDFKSDQLTKKTKDY
jgi:hypothetical protein